MNFKLDNVGGNIMKGRAWKAKYKEGEEHYEKCHGVKEHEITLCDKDLGETWIYDPESTAEITCPQCKRKLDV